MAVSTLVAQLVAELPGMLASGDVGPDSAYASLMTRLQGEITALQAETANAAAVDINALSADTDSLKQVWRAASVWVWPLNSVQRRCGS
jgi:hypothetical protein